MTHLSFEQLTAPITDLAELGVEVLEAWRWLVPATSQPLLLTALGDLFLRTVDGSIEFLDTASGTLTRVASSYDDWKHEMESPSRVAHWFLPALVQALGDSGQRLAHGEVYSPFIPEVIGGKLETENYSPSPWTAHLHFLGELHRQVKDLPPGTPITGIKFPQY